MKYMYLNPWGNKKEKNPNYIYFIYLDYLNWGKIANMYKNRIRILKISAFRDNAMTLTE